jgi:hypothetical protein
MVHENSAAHDAVLAEWRQYAVRENLSKSTGRDGYLFFLHLRHNHPDLLTFKAASRDRWQTIHSWLLRAGFVSD